MLSKLKIGGLKASGYYGKYKAVQYIGTGILMLIGGIIWAITSKSFNWLFLSVFGLVAILDELYVKQIGF